MPRPEQDEEYAKVVVAHCLGGLGRTGTVAASVLVGLGHEPDAAIEIVREARRWIGPKREAARPARPAAVVP